MDNFRQKPNHRPRRRSIDGLLPVDSFKGGGSLGFGSSPSRLGTTSMDDLKRPEGYHPASQPTIARPAAPTAPIHTRVDAPPQSSKGTSFSRSRSKRRGRRRLSSGIVKRSPWKIVRRVAAGFGALALAVGLFFGFKVYILEKNVLRGGGNAPALAQKIDISTLKGEGDGRVNILILGIGGPGHDGPDLTDTIMIASIDPINNQASLLSIPRDLWVKIPNNGSQKINAAFAYGKQQSKSKDSHVNTQAGLSLIEQTLKPIIGIPIHYRAVVDFAAFKQAIDAVGGVTFDVPEQLYDPTIAWENHNQSIIAKKGIQTFNGERALLYARSRETSTDFARGERQRQLLVALKDKVLSAGTYSNPKKVLQLLDSFGDNVYTDFTTGDLNRFYQVASQLPSSSIFSLDLVTEPHSLIANSSINGLSTLQPKLGLYDYSDIQGYIRNALKDGFIQQENAKIAIFNGTETIGLATLKSKELKSYGYNIVSVADAPKSDFAKSMLINVKGQKVYTINYLEKRLGVKASSSLPAGFVAGGADFVIILGGDAVNLPTTN